MEPNSREFYKQCAFQKFCNTVLHNEACDTHRELRRHRAKEVTFSDMTLDEARQLHTFDEYFKRQTVMLSRLVDTFFSRTSWTMLLYAENHSISVA